MGIRQMTRNLTIPFRSILSDPSSVLSHDLHSPMPADPDKPIRQSLELHDDVDAKHQLLSLTAVVEGLSRAVIGVVPNFRTNDEVG